MRFLKIIALILVVAVMVVGWRYMNRLEAEDSTRINQLYTQAEPLEKQKQELSAQREALPVQYAMEFRDYATVEMLFPKKFLSRS